MNSIRVVHMADGEVAVIHPAPKSRRPEETKEEWLARVFAKAMTADDMVGRPYEDLKTEDLPDRKLRKAWVKKDGGGVGVDPDKVVALGLVG